MNSVFGSPWLHNASIEVISTGEKYNTWKNWHLIPTERLRVPPPAQKTNTVDVPGSNGRLDMSDSLNGHPVFDTRSGSWTFYVINKGTEINYDYGEWYDRFSEIANSIHGRTVKVVLQDEPEYYYKGRMTVNDYAPDDTWSKLTLGFEFFPYKLKEEIADTGTVNINGTGDITVVGSKMPITPTFDVASTEYSFYPENACTRGMAIQMLYRFAEYLHQDVSEKDPTSPFHDVKSTDWFYDAVRWGHYQGHIAGYTDTLFGPNNPCTRGQFIQMLWRVRGRPVVTSSIPFTDVKSTDYFYQAVCWAYSKSYIAGTSATTFSPSQAITRAQAVFIMWCSDGKTVVSLDPDETVIDVVDKVNKPWYYDSVMWAWTHKYVAGTSETTFDPAVESTRAHYFTVLYAWYASFGVNKPLSAEWVQTFDAWKKTQNGYIEPITVSAFKADMNSAGLTYTDDEYERMYALIQAGVTNSINNDQSRNPDYATDRICPFTDLAKKDYWFYPAIWAYHKRYTEGVDESTFGANIPITRWQCVYTIWKVANEPMASVGNRASDVSQSAIYAKAVDWAVEVGITALESDKKFNPGGIATRAMITQFFYKLAQWWGDADRSITTDPSPFEDVQPGEIYYTKAVDWALVNGMAAKAGSGMDIIQNGKTIRLVEGESVEPRVVVVDGVNVLQFKGKGTVRVRFQRGSL